MTSIPIIYSDEEKLKRYQRRVMAAEEATKNWRSEVERFLKYYQNKQPVYTRGGQQVRVPLTIQAVDSMYAALTAFDVSISITPLGITTRAQTKVAEQALYIEWLRAKVQEKGDDAVKEALIAGIGYVKVTYDYEDEEKTDQEIDEDIKSYEEENPGATQEELVQEISDTRILRDRVMVEHIPYDELIYDPEAKHWRDIRWVAQRLELPLEEVKEDPDISNAAKKDLKADSAINPKWRQTPANRPEKDEERIILWEIWDFETGTNCLIHKDHDKILKESPNPYAFNLDMEERNPYVPLILRSNPGKVPGISDVDAMRSSVDEANVLRSNLATWVDRHKTKVIAREQTLTDAGKAALRSQEHGAVVEITGNSTANDIRPLELPHLPPEAFQQDQKALGDAREAIGLNEVLQGMLPTGRKTATAMNQLAAATETRHSEKRNRIERFYRNIARRMLNLMQIFYDEPRITSMTDPIEGKIAWEWTADDLTMEHQIELTVEPKPVKDHATRKEELMGLLNYLSAIGPIVDQGALVSYILEELGIPAEVVGTLLKSPQQMQGEAQGAAQQEAAMAQAGQGQVPDPSMMPGPASGGELMASVNPGEEPQVTPPDLVL